MPKENLIRDRLSATLEVLEPGLTLVEVNHKLPNDVGAKGFIDILARDRLGNLVIIELKRSDQTAREALFEILKYMPLFRRQHGTPAHRIRCFIVSTTWHELLVPFSEFRRLCETQTEGFLIAVDNAGNVLSAEKVTDHPEEPTARPFSVHCAYLYPSPEAREGAVPLIRAALGGAGAQGYLLFRLDYRGDSTRVIYPFAVYVVPTRIEGTLLASLNRSAAEEVESEDGTPPEPAAVRNNVEDTFLSLVNESLGDHFGAVNLELSVSSPDAFTAMVEGGWVASAVERVGPYSSAAVIPDAELIQLVKGLDGDNSVRFERLTSPSHRLDWAEVRACAAHCLRGNPTWQAGYEWFLDRIDREFPGSTVLAKVYNPLLLPESLYRFAVEGTPDYVPQLALTVLPSGGGPVEALLGTIVWDGKTVPASVSEAFEICNGVADYYLHKATGVAWELDEELMRRHGLEYSLWWLTFGPKEVQEAKRMAVTEDGTVEQATEGPKPDSLTAYLGAARQYLQELFGEIDRHVGRF